MFNNATKGLMVFALVAGTTAIAMTVTSASAQGWGRGYGYNSTSMQQAWHGPRFGNKSNIATPRNGSRGNFAGRRGVGYLAMMQNFDINKDGALSKDEMTAGLKKIFEDNDEDGDKSISLAEFKPNWTTMTEPMRVQVFQRRDRDGDGKITLSEMTSPGLAMFERRDINNDDKLDSADCPQCRAR
ncbi:hypothetical protein [uncultured Cohaesibacter sp.]|uniref:EF-hand domain-containing protein n=1 Tax=uncultured Cohaesibacter sp. TaxID=1002546 RepID=UPI0029C90636|nr:hypothetical protein [uncultured Cohaesibacter sp.]